MRQRACAIGLATLMLAACTASGAEGFESPLSFAHGRPTPLHFGLFVTPDPDQNPIDPPERFTGYHVGLDFEIFPGEEEEEVPVSAVCEGNVVYSGYAEGYGGLIVQTCVLDGQPITVLYGHLAIPGLIEADKRVKPGEVIGLLGRARSHDTGGTRKHLHLGMHRGEDVDLRGYVQTPEELEEFIDPATVLPL